jgi:ribosome-associated protein
MPPETPDNPNPPPPAPTSGVEIAPGVLVPEATLNFSFTTSRGPGGQNVNKRLTACELRLLVADLPIREPAKNRLRKLAGARLTTDDELILVSDEHRSQQQNKAETLARLREMLVKAITPPKPRVKTKPTRGSKERRIKAKKEEGQKKSRRQKPDW